MTLQQLRYIVTIAETGNITEAARRLFVSQPSLTNSVHDLETEFQLTIFNLKNKGVTLSLMEKPFLSYARQILEQVISFRRKIFKRTGA